MQDEIVTQSERTRRQGARPIVGYLAPSLQGMCEPAWRGIIDAVQERDVDLICFDGARLCAPGFTEQSNIIYNLITAENVDGVISWASMIGENVSVDELEAFHARYLPLPIVTIGRVMACSYGVLMDSHEGMREAIAHLIEVHGCRRLAFIRGPENHVAAQGRYRAYVETLEEYGISLDPNLVTPPAPWGGGTGAEAVRLLLDERGLRLGSDLEAIVSVSEDVLVGALETLQARGIQVPRDVAAVGFDDNVGQAGDPPLTTVAPSLYELGYQAAEKVLDLMAGRKVPKETIVPSKLVVRRSCGCLDPAVAAAGSAERSARKGSWQEIEGSLGAQVRSEIVQVVGGHVDQATVSGWVDRLVDGFVAELAQGTPDLFLSKLEEVLYQVITVSGAVSDLEQRVVVWQDALSVLRRWMLPYLDGEARVRAEGLWEQARVMVGEAVRLAYARRVLQAEQQAQVLRDLEATLITTFGVDELMDVLAESLPRLGIPSFYVSLYESPAPYRYPQPAPEWSWLALACDEADTLHPRRIELEAEKRRFATRQWLPEGVLRGDDQYCFVAQSLYLRENQLGFSLFEVGPREAGIYAALRERISSTLYGALLLQERERAEVALEKAYAEVERQVQERTAELEQEIEERQRVQAESLRLQQEVIEAQKHAIQELSTPIIPVLEGVIVMPLIGSIDTLRAKDVTRSLLAGIREHGARVVILDITGVPIVDSGVATYLNKTIQAARLKGARTIVTGVSEAVAETIVDLGIDWSQIETLRDLRTGLRAALQTRARAEGNVS